MNTNYFTYTNKLISKEGIKQDHAMIQVITCWPVTAEAWVHAQVTPCEICGGQSGIGTGFPPWLSILIYHLRDERKARWRLQFRDIISPHQHAQNKQLITQMCG
jgi:hypothetical protein